MAIIVKKPAISPEIAPLYTSSLERSRLFAGLGNPGKEYANNRHNVGFMCLNRLAEMHETPWQNKKDFKSHFAQIDLGGCRLLLVKPQTYVNLSGTAILPIIRFYKLQPEDVYIIHDEIRLPFGMIEVCATESNFGHNGLKSIQTCLGNSLQLIRVGIGPKEPAQIALSDFVLTHFTPAESERLPKIAKEVCSLIGEAGSGQLKPEKRSVL